MKLMGWLRNILKGASSSSAPKLEEECYRNIGDSEDDSSSTKDCDEENGVVIGTDSYPCNGDRYSEDRNQTKDSGGYNDARPPWLYAEVTEEDLALDLRQKLRVENLPPYDGATNYEFQPYPYFPPAYRYSFPSPCFPGYHS